MNHNFIGCFIWHKKLTGGYDNKNINTQHDYILAFSRSISTFEMIPEVKESSYKLSDENGRKFKWDSLWNVGGLTYSASLDYPIAAPDGSDIWPIGERGVAFWLWSKKKVEAERHLLKFEIDKNGQWKVYKRVYASDGIVPGSMLDKDVVKGNTHSSAEIKQLFSGEKLFDYAKPTTLIKFLVSRAAKSSDLVLDFFSGSGTSAHAVMQLNAEDGGKRRFIMVQLPEPTPVDSDARKAGFMTIADISRKRIELAGEKIKADSLMTTQELDTGFRAYKLADTHFSKWRVTSEVAVNELEQHLLDLRDSADDAAQADDLLTELLLKLGYSLTEPIHTETIAGLEVRKVGDNDVLAYLNEHAKPTLEQLRALVDAAPARIIVLEDAFQGDDELKTNLAQHAKSRGIELWTA